MTELTAKQEDDMLEEARDRDFDEEELPERDESVWAHDPEESMSELKKLLNQEGGVNETGKMSEMSQKETIDKTFEDRQSQTTL